MAVRILFPDHKLMNMRTPRKNFSMSCIGVYRYLQHFISIYRYFNLKHIFFISLYGKFFFKTYIKQQNTRHHPQTPQTIFKSQQKSNKLNAIWYKRYFNHKTDLNRCPNRKIHEQLHISMYIRYIDHRSGALTVVKADVFSFPGKGAPWGAPWGGPASCAQLKSYARPVGFSFFIGNTQRLKRDRLIWKEYFRYENMMRISMWNIY